MSDKLTHRRSWIFNLPDSSQRRQIKSRGFWCKATQKDESFTSFFVEDICTAL
jgi:hypothetical protein